MVARWFRVYEDVIDDPKIILLPEGLRWSWIATLCLASKNGGKLPALAHVAVSLRLSHRRASALLERLHAAGLLDKVDDIYVPHNWDKRQYKSDSADPTAPRRMLRHRNRLRDDANPQANSTGDDSSVTPALRHASVARIRPETEPESERKPDSDLKTDSPQRPPEESRALAEAGRGNCFEMEGKGDSAREASDARHAQADIDAFTVSIAAVFTRAGRTLPDLSRAAFWLREGFDRGVVLATIQQLLASKPDIASLNYFDAAILRAHAARAVQGIPGAGPMAALEAEPEFPIEKAVAFYAKTKFWSRYAGPEPGKPGCRATPELFARHGLSPFGGWLPKHTEGEQS